jgi:hypothetical protein
MQAELDFGEDPLRGLVRVDTMHPAQWCFNTSSVGNRVLT